MTARATYPIREAFFLDKNTKIESGSGNAKDVGLDLGTVKTIRVVVLGADVTAPGGSGTDAKIEFKDADDSDAVFYTVTGAELTAGSDANGVYLDHVRGKLWEGRRNIYYTLTSGGGSAPNLNGIIANFSVYLDSVEVNY
jgi:hypothetical protein